MNALPQPPLPSMEEWLATVQQHVEKTAPDLLPLLGTYAAEARFGRSFIHDDLAQLPAGAMLLELGAGPMLLSCHLAQEGFRVIALEPLGEGFSHFQRLRALVLECATTREIMPQLLDCPAENLPQTLQVDFAFSINVMEHVDDVATVLERVTGVLRPGARYHFTCPNYLFPYEPHCNIPTLFSKRLTRYLFAQRICNNPALPDPDGLWRSLNWITVPQLSRIKRRLPGIGLHYHRAIIASALERVVADQEFAARRAGWFRHVARFLVRFHLHRLFEILPAAFLPIIDCTLIRGAMPQGR